MYPVFHLVSLLFGYYFPVHRDAVVLFLFYTPVIFIGRMMTLEKGHKQHPGQVVLLVMF